MPRLNHDRSRSPATRLDAKVSDDVICGVCLEILIDPCTLECGHTFCKRCVENIIHQSSIRCPSCRKGILRYPSVNIQFRDVIQRLYPNIERERRARLPPNEMREIHNSFNGVAIERLIGIDKLLNAPGGITLSTQVLDHWCVCRGEPSPPSINDVFTVGTLGHRVTIDDVCRALRSIPEEAWQIGRCYFWEGIRISADKTRACIIWGS